MTEPDHTAVTRRGFLKTGALVAAAPLLADAPFVWAQSPARNVTKVHDFQTSADVAKAEQEGEVVYYGHDGEQGIATLLDAFKKDFPKIKTSYVRLQTGALYAKITAERSAGRFGVDVLQLSDISPAIDFQKKGGWEQYASPEYAGYKAEYQSTPPGYYGVPGVGFAGISYNRTKVKPEQAPKTWKDILNPAYRDGISAKLATSGMQHSQWYILRRLYGNDFWPEFAKQRPKGFDARAQLFDRLAKGDDKICALAEYAGYTLYQEKGADLDFVSPPEGLPAIAIYVGVVNKALGHAAGDALLASVGERLRTVSGPQRVVGRLGGDEFAVIARGQEDPAPLAAELLEALEQCGDEQRRVSACVGVAQSPRDGSDAEALLRAGDIALRVAKRSGIGGQASFYAGGPLNGQGAHSARGALTRLIGGEGLSMAVQPIVDLRDGTVHAYEALARFGQGGTDSPLHWFSLAEEFGDA